MRELRIFSNCSHIHTVLPSLFMIKFEIAKTTVRKKKNTSKLLREKLKKEPHTIKMKEFFTGVFPPLSHHRYHEKVRVSIYQFFDV